MVGLRPWAGGLQFEGSLAPSPRTGPPPASAILVVKAMLSKLSTLWHDEAGDASIQATLLLAILTVGVAVFWDRLVTEPSSAGLNSAVPEAAATDAGPLLSSREEIWRQAAASGMIR